MGTYRVTPMDSKAYPWMVMKNGDMKSKHRTKQNAKQKAKQMAGAGHSIVIHRADGTVQRSIGGMG
jgi:predicted transcriptional regulator